MSKRGFIKYFFILFIFHNMYNVSKFALAERLAFADFHFRMRIFEATFADNAIIFYKKNN